MLMLMYRYNWYSRDEELSPTDCYFTTFTNVKSFEHMGFHDVPYPVERMNRYQSMHGYQFISICIGTNALVSVY